MMHDHRARLVRRLLMGSAGVLVALLLLIGGLTGYTMAAGQTISVELGIIGVRTGPRPARMVHFPAATRPCASA